MKSLCLFSGGKDSAMALLNEIEKGNDCISLIAVSESRTQLSDGPEANIEIVKAISEEIFNTPAFICSTSHENFRRELSDKIQSLINEKNISCIVTGDLDHKDGIIHYLKSTLSPNNPGVTFYSIGEKYRKDNKFLSREYLTDILGKLHLEFVSIRLPDFKGFETEFIGRIFDQSRTDQLVKLGIDPLGEDGEYQSLVTGFNGSYKSLQVTHADISVYKGRDVKNYDYLVQEITKWKMSSL